MSRDKKRRSDRSHGEYQGERPASTDVADLAEDTSAQATSDAQRRAPTAGPSQDDRFGEGALTEERHGRVIQVSVVGDRTRITVALGHEQGVRVGMEGYLKDGDGMAASFQIDEVKERTSYAFVDVPISVVQQHLYLVVNPSSLPKAQVKQDMKTRVIGISVEGGRTRILIALGSNHGARHGMKGHLVGDSGRPYTDFEIAEEHPGHSVAYVTDTVDNVRAHSQVVLNPS